MTLSEFKNKFTSSLTSIYPKEEIDSFYFLLIEHYLGFKRIDIALDPSKIILENKLKKLSNALEQLQQEIPIQYIIGSTEFYGLPFKVNKNTLIPRPETEELVEWILNDLKKNNHQSPITILDIGTGSGCIAISLAKNLPDAKIFALDVSHEALNTAKENALLNKVNISFIQQDILTSTSLSHQNAIASTTKKSTCNKEIISSQTPHNDIKKFDIIVSNPPYVRELEKLEIKNNVLNNEPHLALFVDDNNPLLFYDKIADFAKENLKPNGQLFFEINQYLGTETSDLLKQKKFNTIELKKDIFKNNRMIKANYSSKQSC